MDNPTIVVVDYQAGNLRSVQKALERNGAFCRISAEPKEIDSADALVFPGQGACDSAMRQLKARDLVNPIKDFIDNGKPFLGICLGLQLLLEESDEGEQPGMGVLPGRVRRLPDGVKIPHMGWNRVDFRISHPILDDVPSGSYFYFVHSYYAAPDDEKVVAGTTSYGIEFCSAVAWRNVLAVQFHPEKSGATGLKLYSNFVRMVNASVSGIA